MSNLPLADTAALPEWQRNIKDDVLVSQLSLPGTHNSAACYHALPSVRCQGQGVTEQLNHGVRFFDLRVARPLVSFLGSKDDLQVVHGNFPVKIPMALKLSDVLDEFYKFIQDHPSELPIISIKQEGNDTWEGDEFPNLIWKNYIHPREDKWYLENKIPKLGEARGKLMLFRRFGVKDEQLKAKYGFEASWWKYNTPSDDRGKFTVQDWCEVKEPTDLKEKVGYINEQLQRAVKYNETEDATRDDGAKLFVNFCSGSNFFNKECWPEGVAKAVSEGISGMSTGCGIVVIDYAEANDWKIPRQLVEINKSKFSK